MNFQLVQTHAKLEKSEFGLDWIGREVYVLYIICFGLSVSIFVMFAVDGLAPYRTGSIALAKASTWH